MSTPILTTKLYIPKPPSNLVPRISLIEKLSQNFEKKITLVSAPAGFGKTTLLSECAANCEYPTAWLSLDGGDNETARFLSYLITALQTIDRDIGESALNTLNSLQSGPMDIILTNLINDVAKTPDKFVLVLDDYHVIESSDIDQGIIYLLSNLPPQMHLVIASRTDPTFPLPRLRSLGQIMEIRADDLRFTPAEAAIFLKNRMGLNISNQDIVALEARIEGWIAGLQMVALSIQGLNKQSEISQFVSKFSSSHRYIMDYLTDEVLQQRPTGTKEFLLHTSILDRLNEKLCNAVTGVENSQEILEALEAANLFIVPLDNERVWYRYHHLFGELLRVRLERATPKLMPELHRRASTWYANNDFLSEAITHSLTAEDFERAAKLTEQIFFDRMGHGEDFSIMMTRLIALPEDIIQASPFLGIMYAWMLSITLQLDQVEPHLVDIETRFDGQLPAELQRQIASIRSEVLRHQGKYQRSIESCLQILETLPEEPKPADQQTYTGIVSDLAWGYVMTGDMDMAHKWFTESLAVGQHSITLTLLGLYGLALTLELSGQLQQAIDTCLRGLHLIEETSQKIDNDVPAAIYIHMMLGNLLRERNQLEEAEKHLELGLALGQKWNTVGDTMRDVYLHISKLKLARGDFPGAMDVLSQAQKLVPHYQSVPGFGDTIAVHKALIGVAWALSSGNNGHLGAVSLWARERNLSVGESVESINKEFEYLVWARLLLAQKKFEKAIKVLEGLIDLAEEKNRAGRVIEMCVLQSLAFHALGDTTKALDKLESALALAEHEGYVRLFVDEGSPMEEMLRQAATQNINTNYANKLLNAFNLQEAGNQSPSPASAPQSVLVEPLSKREFEVLKMLADGATNQEIAEELVVAITTAKKHVSNIIGKLEVANRTQAVVRARELNLI